jgi:GTP:adenosylcobinamide-phosphate guanylyltransferase
MKSSRSSQSENDTNLLDALLDNQQYDTGWTAIILAGQRPGPDPLASAFGIEMKAVVPLCGKPMIAWVLESLLGCTELNRIIILTQDTTILQTDGLQHFALQPRVSVIPSGKGIASSILRYAGTKLAPWPIIVTTADHPLLTPLMVKTVIERSVGFDVSIAAVEQQTVEKSYPRSKRTWLRFADGNYSGANLFALRTSAALPALNLWTRAEQDRKQALKLFWHFGPLLAIRAALRLIGFREAIDKAGRNLGLRANLVELKYAEAAIDVDKLSDHQDVERILQQVIE